MASAIHRDSQLLQYFGAFKGLFTAPASTTSSASISSIEDDVFAISQALEEASNKEHVLASDQKCSKILEKALYRLCSSVISILLNEKIPNSTVSDTFDKPVSVKSIELFVLVFKGIVRRAFTLSTSPYSSHVLQTLFTLLLQIYVSLGDEVATLSMQLAVLPKLYLEALKASPGSLLETICNVCGSHVIRSFLFLCGGYMVYPTEETLGHRNSKARKTARKEVLPPVCKSVPTAFDECLFEITEVIMDSLRGDPLYLSLNCYGATVVEILLLILKHRGFTYQLDNLINAILFLQNLKDVKGLSRRRLSNDAASDTAPTFETANAFIESPVGSRLLEKIIECINDEAFHLLFTKWMLPQVNHLAVGRVGNFVVQSFFASPHFTSMHLKQFIDAIDIRNCRDKGYTAILWRCAECCRRLQYGYKLFVQSLLHSFEIYNSKDFPRIWPSLLLMESEGGFEKSSMECLPESSDTVGRDIKWELERIHPSGCSLLFCLLKFPSKYIQSIVGGFRSFVKLCKRMKQDTPAEKKSFLKSFATDRQGSHLVQGIVSTDSPIPSSVKEMFIKCFRGTYGFLSTHPLGGFVVTSFYKAADVSLKKQIVSELLVIKDQLKSQNYAVYKFCELNHYLKDRELWESLQTKKSKTHALFRDILAPMDIASQKKSKTSSTILKPPEDESFVKNDDTHIAEDEKRTQDLPFQLSAASCAAEIRTKRRKRKRNTNNEDESASQNLQTMPLDNHTTGDSMQTVLEFIKETGRSASHRPNK